MGDRHHTLLLLRHAKSAWPEGVVDRDRPLAPRGVREAGLAGEWLRANFPRIDRVLCSTATRARETWARAAIQAPVRFVERLYGASPETVIDELNRVEEQVNSLLVIGHEPTTSAVALRLGGAEGTDNGVVERVSAKFPTSAIAVLQVPGRWQDLHWGGAALVGFHVPR
ncbi:histidine phosphatase family protein [Mycobacterium sp. SM1]|uniref:SixA phosphatase family protein n=1 Tax=Mycobacterium sp. SM1 TaxID=2816243 RepID=UPI001BD1A28A|nr:histidine phosphatase family protein [Mycobacterium sp. SM1]MBS4727324.1 histidine phosphatase family protein [Mycobacterium sp. SM1]